MFSMSFIGLSVYGVWCMVYRVWCMVGCLKGNNYGAVSKEYRRKEQDGEATHSKIQCAHMRPYMSLCVH